MYKYMIYAFSIVILLEYISGLDNEHTPIIILSVVLATLFAVFFLVAKLKYNFLQGVGLGLIVGVIIFILVFMLYMINKEIFHYYLDIPRFKIFYKS